MKGIAIPIWKQLEATPKPVLDCEHHTIMIVGGGPVGLTLALDLGLKGQKVVLINQLDHIPGGSKGICYSKRTLDIWNRMDVAKPMLAKGVAWNKGKVFRGTSHQPIYAFDLMEKGDQEMPAFINLQQYHVEAILIDKLSRMENVDLRWGHCLTDTVPDANGVEISVETGAGSYHARCDWLIACDGSKSSIRELLGLDFAGRVFEDNFLIADIRMKGDRAAERWFWFDPPFNPGRSALLHRQPDDIWRLDFQLGRDVDRKAAVLPENVDPLIRGMLGPDVAYEPVWYSLYTFQCRRMERFVHGRVLFAGDAAHLVSPFGARGANGGIADADNLGWKLDRVIRGEAPHSLIESYNAEAITIADENILNSTRATDFISPKSAASRAMRDAVLDLATAQDFARPFVNSGRLSNAVPLGQGGLQTPDCPKADWQGGIAPGWPAADAKTRSGWLLAKLGGLFTLLSNGQSPAVDGCTQLDMTGEDQVCAAFDLAPGDACLIRPDQIVAARWRGPDAQQIRAALSSAIGSGQRDRSWQ
ncbi:MAG: FAD-dependent monooxygenase [Sphingopyxis sp.]